MHRNRAKAEGKNVMKSGFVYRVKADQDGFIKSFEDGGYKSRFVCKGYSEIYEQDYWNVRSGVVDYSSARLLIALAASECAELWTFDIKSAFTTTDVPEGEEFYCEAPEDTKDNELFGGKFIMEDGSRGVLRCSKCLYGSKNSPRRFWQKLVGTLRNKGGFEPTIHDSCVLTLDRTSEGGGIIRLALWVDDILLSATNPKDKEWFENMLKSEFELSGDSGVEPACHYLGMKITRDRSQKKIKLSSPALVESLVNDLISLGHLKPESVVREHPMTETKLTALEENEEKYDEEKYPYRKVVGVCLHLSRTTRPDIALAVSELSSHVTKFGERHARAATFLVSYLRGTADLGIVYTGDQPTHLLNKMISFSDADWAGDSGTRKSRSGFTLQINGGPFEWYAKGQTLIATSSCMSETIAAAECAKAIVTARLLLFELGYAQPGSSRLYVDNEATVLNANGERQSKRSKHFQIRTELLRAYSQLGRLHVYKIDTNNNISDLHTKPLTGKKFMDMRDIMMGLRPEIDLMHLSLVRAVTPLRGEK